MNDAQTAARGHRAALCAEFIAPILSETRDGYLARIAELAVTELDPRVRTEKITALSFALKVLGNVENGVARAVDDGKLAEGNLMRADKIERMTPSQRRLFGLVPTR